ncbi:MAG: signal peptidase I, partial [Thermoprotei archaeon]
LRPGDIVLTTPTTDIQIGDIIAYASAAGPIIHRVVSIVVEDGNVTYRTKGDANNAPDPFIITKEAVIGELRFRIPYIGLPLLYGAMVLGGLPNLVTVILLTVFFLHFVSVNKEVIRNRRK